MTTKTIAETTTDKTSLADSKQKSLTVSHLHIYIEGVLEIDVYPRVDSIRVLIDSLGKGVFTTPCSTYDMKGLSINREDELSKENE